MDASQVNTLGGFCELIGVGFVARDLISLASYRGKLAQLAAWFGASWAGAAARVSRLLRRPGRNATVYAQAAAAVGAVGHVTARGFPGPFVAQPDQSIEDRLAALAMLVNRLRDEVVKEPQERARAILAEREERRRELTSEAERLERLIAEARQELVQLREATTGDLGLRIESVAFLAVGILFTVWPEDFARWLPGWPPFTVAVFAGGAYLVARFSWVRWLRPGEDQPQSPSPRVGCGVLWHGRP